MNGIVEGIAGNAVWGGVSAFARKLTGNQIQITSPRPLEALTGRQPLGKMWQFPVRGTLKRVPKDHEIWLLNQDERTGLLRPQGFSIVKYDPRQGTWFGMICSYAPISRAEVVEETIKTIALKGVVEIKSWKSLLPTGRPIITRIFDEIRACKCFIADRTA
jgi:hypothetical protein